MLHQTTNAMKSVKPLSIAVSTLLLAACSSTPTTQNGPITTSTVRYPAQTFPSIVRQNNAQKVQQNAALLDMDSLDELEGLLEATDMTMVENNSLLVRRYGNLWDRMRVNFKMDSNRYDPRIEAQKSWFVSRQDYLNRLTARASRYLYHTVLEAERRNIPTELALLPVIESSYDPNASSNAAAAGLWQFIPSTGRIYGLNQTPTFDGRRDVIESTRAAYDFLTTLYNQFGSWELALAAYNAGPGRIQSAINYNAARGLPTDYWSLRLPTETMNYVPRFMAVAQIIKNPSSYNVYLPAIANRQHFRSVPANVGVTLNDVSNLTGVSYDELRALNASLVAGSVDAAGPSRVLIPNDISESVDKRISQLTGSGYMSASSYQPSRSYVTPTTTTTSNNSWSSNTPSSWSSPSTSSSSNSNDTLTAAQQVFKQKEGSTRLPSTGNDLAAMATNMLKSQTTTYVAPTMPSSNGVNREPPITLAEQRSLTAEMQSSNTLPTTSVAITSNNTIIQEPPLSQAERDSIAAQIEQSSPQVQQAINPTDGNIKINAIQTQQSILEAKGETKRLSYEEPPIDPAKRSMFGTPTPSNPQPQATPQRPVIKRPAGDRTTYQVKHGDTLAIIAARTGINWRDIANWNQIDPNKALWVGTTLYLYNAKPNIDIKPIVKKSRPDSYMVQAGETLTSIANRFGLGVSELAKFNNLPVDYQVRTRQNLWLIPDRVPASRGGSSSSSKVSTNQGPTSRYTVQVGDTLIGIANKLSVDVEDITDLNDFDENYRVQRGQVITVPVSQTKTNYALNGKSVTYVVKSGESLGSIADEYNISVSELAKANYLKPTAGVLVNQRLTIPQPGNVSIAAVTRPTNASNHVEEKVSNVKPVTNATGSKYKGNTILYQVKPGDSLINLANQYGISPSTLASINYLKPNANLLLGQTLRIPKTTVSYTVKPGDSLILLAKKYGMSTKKLADMNNISTTTELRIGQVLTVPNN